MWVEWMYGWVGELGGWVGRCRWVGYMWSPVCMGVTQVMFWHKESNYNTRRRQQRASETQEEQL